MRDDNLNSREALIDSYDLSYVHERLQSEGLLAGEDLRLVEHEFKRFMKLVLAEEGPLAVIDRRVDEFWHSFILFTPQYDQFCMDRVGFFVHHQPRTKATPIPQIAIKNFVNAYQSRYGKLEPFWIERIDPRFKTQIAAGITPSASEFQWSGWTGRPKA